ncbi:diguanylate cyclase [Neiella marina]|uniref:Diguanylate cyclase n=1 Tax=Neiella holothuriorum TaxID=2870530 RepID=A0ABS7ECU3_9GAMM|nr:diguanylate cyclase [Neiella holothuriorum]MBW8190135.1 diguanylate cyclase [Neiella holothuriorum]
MRQILLLAILLVANTVCAAARTIQYNNDPSPKEQYIIGLLDLALEKSGSGMVMQANPEVWQESRIIQHVERGEFDVYWGAASTDNEAKMRAIRIPLTKGLLGYRLFIVKPDQQHRFTDINTLSQLKQLSAGQGRFWGDTQVLQHAGIPTETAIKYQSLFHMLEGERFDYFPRAVHEPWAEVEAYPELNLTVESHVLLTYPLAMYFYVNKQDDELAVALEAGLEQAISDGSFDAYFYGHPMIRDSLAKANIDKRTVIRIDNPYLPDTTPLERKELWLDLAALRQY